MRNLRYAVAALLSGVLILCAVASCQPVSPGTGDSGSMRTDSIPSGTTASNPEHRAIPTGASSYGRSTLPEYLQEAYDALAEALTDREETVALPVVTAEELTQVMTCVRRDHPIETWLKSEYSFETNTLQSRTTVHLAYAKDKVSAIAERKKIAAASKKLLDNIDASLPDFDKATILYDRLCDHVVYDLDAPNRDEVYGAVIDGRAACQGYAKAYQYLLSRMGIESLIVYGTAKGGAHAWNIVRLDGDYYLADATWGDVVLDDGFSYISHEFLFLDDESFLQTHQPLEDGTNYSLPVCGHTEQNYFIKNGTAVSSAAEHELESKLGTALDLAAANRYSSVQLRFLPPLTTESVEAKIIADGRLDQIFHRLASRRGMKASTRSFNPDTLTLTYLISYD